MYSKRYTQSKHNPLIPAKVLKCRHSSSCRTLELSDATSRKRCAEATPIRGLKADPSPPFARTFAPAYRRQAATGFLSTALGAGGMTSCGQAAGRRSENFLARRELHAAKSLYVFSSRCWERCFHHSPRRRRRKETGTIYRAPTNDKRPKGWHGEPCPYKERTSTHGSTEIAFRGCRHGSATGRVWLRLPTSRQRQTRLEVGGICHCEIQ